MGLRVVRNKSYPGEFSGVFIDVRMSCHDLVFPNHEISLKVTSMISRVAHLPTGCLLSCLKVRLRSFEGRRLFEHVLTSVLPRDGSPRTLSVGWTNQNRFGVLS